METAHYLGIGFIALLALALSAYLVWGLVTFAHDVVTNQLQRDSRGKVHQTGHTSLQIVGASGWSVLIGAALFALLWAVGAIISGIFGL